MLLKLHINTRNIAAEMDIDSSATKTWHNIDGYMSWD